jgi:hypothetical protein
VIRTVEVDAESVKLPDAVRLAESVVVTENVVLPTEVGVPEIVPLEARFRPAGKLPLASCQL